MAIKVTKTSREKIVREMIDVFKKHAVLDNMAIVYNNQMVSFGEMKIDLGDTESDDLVYTFSEPKVTQNKCPENWSGNKNTLVVLYDGGALYSCMSGEFGYNWRSRLEEDLERVFGPYHLAIEEIDHVSFTLAEGFEPEYETVMKKLSNV